MELRERKDRREGIILTVIGIVFVAAGVFLLMIGNPWMGAIGLAFGTMGVAMGYVMAVGTTSPLARIAAIIGCAAFAVTGTLALTAGVVAPDVFGGRGRAAGIVAGVLLLGFFGPGTVLLIIKELRLRRPSGS